VTTGALTSLVATFPPRTRGRAFGVWGLAGSAVFIVAPLVGGALTEWVSWRATFFVALPVLAVAAVAIARWVPGGTTPGERRRVDVIGLALLAAAVVALTFAALEVGSAAALTDRAVAFLVVAAVAGTGFVVVERRSLHPLLNRRLLSMREFRNPVALMWVAPFALAAFSFFVTLFVQNALGFTPLEAGLAFVPLGVVGVLAEPWTGRWSDRGALRAPLVLGFALTAVGLLWMSAQSEDSSFADIVGPMVVMGLALALVSGPLNLAAQDNVPDDLRGSSSGITALVSKLAGMLGLALAVSLFTFVGAERLGDALAAEGAPVELTGELNGQAWRRPPEVEARLAAMAPEQRAAVEEIGQDAYVGAFRTVMYTAAGASVLGIVLAVALLPRRRTHP
jgi:MFS family permease